MPIALGVIVAVLLATRLALTWRFPPFWDEAGYGEWAKGAAEGASTRTLSMLEGKEPLTSWLGALWIHAGAGYLTAVRLVSVVAALVSALMLFLVGRRLSVTTGLVASGLYAVLPLFVVHDAQGLMEPTVAAAAMCVLYCAIRLAERPSVDMALLLGLAMGAGLLTKETGRFAIAMVPLSLLVFDYRAEGRTRRVAGWIGGVVLAGAVAFGCYAILMISPNWDVYRKANDGYHRPVGDGLRHAFSYLSAAASPLGTEFAAYVGPVLMALILAGLVIAVRRHARLGLLVGLWGALPFVATTVLAGNVFTRYWVPSATALCLPMAVGLIWAASALPRQVPSGPQRRAALAVLAVAVAAPPGILLARVLANPSTASYPGVDEVQFVTSWSAGTGWRSVADYLDRATAGQPFTLVYDRARPLFWFLKDRDRVMQIPQGTPTSTSAQWLVKNYPDPPLSPQERSAFVLVRAFPRPHHGQAILLYRHR